MTIPEFALAWLPLADAVAKTTAILLIAAAAALVLRQASAALRHLVWTLALTSALVLPIASLALPRWQLSLFRIADAPASRVAAAAPPAPDTVGAASTPSVSAPSLGIKDAADAVAAPPQATGVFDGWSWQEMLLAVWSAGALLILARIAVGLLLIGWLSRRTQEITDAAWLPMAREVARDMGISTRLRFLRGGRESMPVAAGIFRPAVIMPEAADSWPESRLRVVVLHELAHVKRRDCLTHVLAQAACALHWFNPLAWLAAKRARAERERACDDLVLACGTRSADYADQLLEMARVLRGDRLPALLGGASLAMAHRSQLEGRLVAILDPRLPRSGMTRGRAVAAVVLSCAAVAPLGALQVWTSGPESAEIAALATTIDTAVLPQAASPTPETRPVQPPSGPQDRQAGEPNPAPVPAEIEHEHEAEHEERPHARPVPMPHPAVAEAAAVGQAFGTSIGRAVADSVTSTITTTLVHPTVEPFAGVQDAKPAGDKVARNDPRMVAALTAALKDSDKEVRETAMQALVQLRDPAIFDPLVQALKDGSPDVREKAAFGLGQMRAKRAVQPLIATLKDENADVREQVVFALGQLRDPSAVEGLAIAVRDANADVRQQAVFALGQIRDRRALEPLISALKDAAPDVREQAAFALGQIRDRAAVDALMVAIKDADTDVREQVVFALGQLRDPKAIDALMIALKDQNADVRRQAAFALGQLAR